MNDYNISLETRQTRLDQQRQKMKVNMNRKIVHQIKSIQSNDNHLKLSQKSSIIKDDRSPLMHDEDKTRTSIIKTYDGPQAYDLMNVVDDIDDEVEILDLHKESYDCFRVPSVDSELRDKRTSLIFEYGRDDYELEQCSRGDGMMPRKDSSCQMLSEFPKMNICNERSCNGSTDGSLDTSGVAIAPCFSDNVWDNTDSTDDAESIQFDVCRDRDSLATLDDFVDRSPEIEKFVSTPGPKKSIVRCRISRDNHGVDKGLFPIYYLHLERSNFKPVFLLAARRRKLSKTSHYLISSDATDMKRGGFGFLAKLRSNFIGTQFSIFDNGSYPGSRVEISKKSRRRELAAIVYDSNVLGFNGPRRMTVLVPRLANIIPPGDAINPDTGDGLIESWKKNHMENLLEFQNKKPTWNDESQSYVLNFHGRVTQASVKNFQIVNDTDESSFVLQFGRTSENSFSMDYSYPLSAVQAFGIALSSVDGKLACE